MSDIPFDFFRNEVVIQVRIAGAGPYAMLLDTGTDPSTIDLALARRIHLPLTSSGQSGNGGGTGRATYYSTTLPNVRIGGLTATKIDALAVDLTALSRTFHRPILGVLGYSLLKNRIVLFDYPKKHVRLYTQPLPTESDHLRDTPNHARLPFRYADYVLLDQLVVNGKRAVGGLDTGSNSVFTVTSTAVVKLGLAPELRRSVSTSGAGFNGRYQSRRGVLPTTRLGAVIVAAPEATFWPAGAGHDHDPFDINIGNGFLKDFVLTLDFRNRIAVLDR